MRKSYLHASSFMGGAFNDIGGQSEFEECSWILNLSATFISFKEQEEAVHHTTRFSQ
jgi:hypothetical protein